MIAVAVVVLGMQYYTYRKNRGERMQGAGIESLCRRSSRNESTARGTQGVALPS